jgi:hypothetical protein
MKEKFLNLIISGLLILSTASFFGCGGEADTVDPEAISQSVPGSLTGTIYPQIISVNPANGSTDIPVDTDIVIVFSKPILSGSIAGNVSISGGATLDTAAPVLVSGGSTVILDVDSGDLAYGSTYTVTIGAGITDTDGNALSSGASFSFDTAASSATALQPRVIAATRYPIAPTVAGIGQSYVEVTFTDYVTLASVQSEFSVVNGVFVPVTSGLAYGVDADNPLTVPADHKTFRINLNPLLILYGQTYNAALTTSIQTSTGIFLFNSDLTWSFTIETDPDLVVTSVTAIWVSSVTDTNATIKFITSKPVELNDCYAVYDTNPVVDSADTHVVENAAATLSTLHTVTIPLLTLTPLTQYYFIAGVDTTGDGVVDTLSSEISFYTDPGIATNSTLTAAALNQGELQLLQTNGLGSYAFWVSDNSTIYGQYFNTAAGAPEWTDPGGEPIATAGGQNGVIAITDGFAEAELVYNDSDNLYAKMVYDNAGAFAFRWGGGAGAQGTDLGLAIKPGSTYSACIVHERPVIVSSGAADMPDATLTNLLYDADVIFSAYFPWLTAGDLLLTNTAGIAWNNYAIDLQSGSVYDIFPYVIRSTAAAPIVGSVVDYYIVDSDVASIISGIADSGTTTTQLRSSTTNLMTVSIGDIISTSAGSEWGIASSNGAWNVGGWWYVNINPALGGLADADTFDIYKTHIGPFTSEVFTNPLWDAGPTPLFNPGVTVLAGDYVVNENNNTVNATSATVSAIDVSRDTDYALRLSTNIMFNGNVYSIVRLPTGFIYKDVGYRAALAADFTLTDDNLPAPFGTVAPGDIVFNIDQNLSAMVTSAAPGLLTITADIFNAVNDKAIIYTKRGFLVTYVDTSDYIRARAFNIATGTPLSAAFNVCTDGVNSNPVAVSDGAGNSLIFYQKSGNIYAKKVSAKGEFLWAAPADTAGGTGRLLLSTYTIVQVLPEAALNGTGGAYLLAKNPAGTVYRLLRINGTTGATAFDTIDVTGKDPQMAVDTVTGVDRAIVVYRNTHLSGGVLYYHIEARSYGGVPWSNLAVSDITAAANYNCQQPSITLADNTAGTDGIYISWFDGRYYNPSGYSIFAQRLNAAGAAQWAANGVLVSTPGSMGDFDHTLYMRLLYYNDLNGSPYGVMPIWLDYRDYAGTGADIYYEQIVN